VHPQGLGICEGGNGDFLKSLKVAKGMPNRFFEHFAKACVADLHGGSLETIADANLSEI